MHFKTQVYYLKINTIWQDSIVKWFRQKLHLCSEFGLPVESWGGDGRPRVGGAEGVRGATAEESQWPTGTASEFTHHVPQGVTCFCMDIH